MSVSIYANAFWRGVGCGIVLTLLVFLLIWAVVGAIKERR